jgi:hypothetical protein
MATVTWRVTTPDDGSTPNTSGGFDISVNDLVIVLVATSASTGFSGTMSAPGGSGITSMAAVGVVPVFAASANTVNMFVSNQFATSAISNTTVTWTPTDVGTATIITVFTIAGMSRTGTNAVKQTAKQDNLTSGSPSATFGSSCLTGNPTICATGDSVSDTITAPTGWTDDGAGTTTAPVMKFRTAHRNSGFTGTAITWNGSTAGSNGTLHVEFDSSAAGGGGPIAEAVLPRIIYFPAVDRAARW